MNQKKTPSHNELFILFPESPRTQFFIYETEICQTEEQIDQYLFHLNSFLDLVNIEKYSGFYDCKNINNFLFNFDVLDDLYLINPQRILRTLLKEWESWRDEQKSIPNDEYKVISSPTKDNSFGEIHSRITKNSSNGYLLISHGAINLKKQVIEIEHSMTKQKKNIECQELENAREWFVNNRKPKRIYHPSPKHGENGKGEWKNASKLLCMHKQAEIMLHKAVGLLNIDELYYFDENNKQYIIFRYEGKSSEEKYHAYHLDSSTVVDKHIIKQIEQIIKNPS